MRGPSLHAATVLSACGLHLAFFLIAAFLLRYSRNSIMPSPYEVSLVDSISSSQGAANRDIPEQGRDTGEPEVRTMEQVKQPNKAAKDSKADQKSLDEQIAALKAKKKMHDIVDLRRKVASISSSKGKNSLKRVLQGSGAVSTQEAATYTDKIVAEIKAEWRYPDWAERDLLMTVNVKIQKDGTLQVLDVEKKSGNPLFDRSVQQAIIKASPVTPPPYEMEIGMRFYP